MLLPISELSMTIRRLYADPDDGQLVGVEARSRAFPASLRRFLVLAHQTCRAPYCDAPIRQMDHVVPWSQGGPTSLDNGNGLCGGDNQKESSGESARVVHDEDGTRRTVAWTTRYGQTAHRRGINVDPFGTFLRRQHRRSPAPETAAGPGSSAEDASATSRSTPSSEPDHDDPTIFDAFARLRLQITDLPLRPVIRPRVLADDFHILESAPGTGSGAVPPDDGASEST